jgi:tRNA-binding EMAP/Myf-like protein
MGRMFPRIYMVKLTAVNQGLQPANAFGMIPEAMLLELSKLRKKASKKNLAIFQENLAERGFLERAGARHPVAKSRKGGKRRH